MDKEHCVVLLKYLDLMQLYGDHLCKADILPVKDHAKFTTNNETVRKQIHDLMDKEPGPVE